MQQSHSGAHQKRTKQAYAFKRTLERFVCGENAIRPQTDTTAKITVHFWTKPAAVVSCTVHYRLTDREKNSAKLLITLLNSR